LLALSRRPLLTIVGAGCRLAAFVHSLDITVRPDSFRPVSNGIVGALAIVPQVVTSHT